MKHRILLSVCVCSFLFIAIGNAFSQDIILLKSGEEIEALVQEVSSYEVRYKKYSFQDGPDYVLPVTEVFMIKYSNGQKDVFEPQKAAELPSYQRKIPALSFLLSFLLPGGGQYYNGQYGKGAAMTVLSYGSLIAAVASLTEKQDLYGDYYYEANGATAVFLIVSFGTSLWSLIDAPISATAINKKNGFLSWNIGKNSNLSLKPDFLLQSYNLGSTNYLEPTYGAKISFEF